MIASMSAVSITWVSPGLKLRSVAQHTLHHPRQILHDGLNHHPQGIARPLVCHVGEGDVKHLELVQRKSLGRGRERGVKGDLGQEVRFCGVSAEWASTMELPARYAPRWRSRAWGPIGRREDRMETCRKTTSRTLSRMRRRAFYSGSHRRGFFANSTNRGDGPKYSNS